MIGNCWIYVTVFCSIATHTPIKSKFLTLTFKDNITDLKEANRLFSKFIMRLKYSEGYEIKYLAIPEFQRRGAVHYHVVMFNLRYIPLTVLEEIWGHGFIKINCIEDVDNVGAYVSKYLVEDIEDERLKGNRAYFKSRGLLKPYELFDEKEIAQLQAVLNENDLVYDNEFDTEFLGKIKYQQYNVNMKFMNRKGKSGLNEKTDNPAV